MLPIALIAAISIHIDLASLFRRPAPPPRPTCGIKIVSYRFVGTPGEAFRYAGSDYVIPASGSIELLADRSATTWQAAGIAYPLDIGPID
jgi:hypothetical protein